MQKSFRSLKLLSTSIAETAARTHVFSASLLLTGIYFLAIRYCETWQVLTIPSKSTDFETAKLCMSCDMEAWHMSTLLGLPVHYLHWMLKSAAFVCVVQYLSEMWGERSAAAWKGKIRFKASLSLLFISLIAFCSPWGVFTSVRMKLPSPFAVCISLFLGVLHWLFSDCWIFFS